MGIVNSRATRATSKDSVSRKQTKSKKQQTKQKQKLPNNNNNRKQNAKKTKQIKKKKKNHGTAIICRGLHSSTSLRLLK
jgi:hypothetical protein